MHIRAFIDKFFIKLVEDKHFSELVRGSSVAFGLKLLGIGIGYIFTFSVTKTLGAKAWGIFTLCIVILQIASVIGRLGMDIALLKFTAEYASKGKIDILLDVYKKILTITIPFSLLVAGVVYFSSPVLSEVFHKPYLIEYFRITSLAIVPFVMLWIHSESIRGLKKIKEYMLLQQTGIFGISLLLFLGGFLVGKIQLYFPLLCYINAIFILSAISIFLVRKYYYRISTENFYASPKTYYSFKANKKREKNNNLTYKCKLSYKTILTISIPILLSNSLALVMGWVDTIMLGIFRSTQEVGVYNVALKLSIVTSITLRAINTIAAPKFAEFWKKEDLRNLIKIAKDSSKLIFWTSLPILLIFLSFPRFILGIFGKKFEMGAVVLIILSIGQFVNAFAGSVGYILIMTDYQKFHQNIIILGVILNVFLNFILIPKYGLIGAAIASTIATIFWNLFFTIKVRNVLKEFIFYLPRLK